MGDDFTNHQVFAGSEGERCRRLVVDWIRNWLAGAGYTEVSGSRDADRSLAIGPADRWVCVYDSAGNGDDPSPAEFEKLSLALSTVAPVVDILMDDSAAVHFYLCHGGRLVDKYANQKGIVSVWQDRQEQDAYRGRPELWSGIVLEQGRFDDLEAAWSRSDAISILSDTAAVLGLHPLLCQNGYTIDYDGVPISYRKHLLDEMVDLGAFMELHYRWAGD